MTKNQKVQYVLSEHYPKKLRELEKMQTYYSNTIRQKHIPARHPNSCRKWAPKREPKWESEQRLEWKPERESEWEPEWETEWEPRSEPEWETEWEPEWETEWVPRWVPEWENEWEPEWETGEEHEGNLNGNQNGTKI